jgi:hypothetical protein
VKQCLADAGFDAALADYGGEAFISFQINPTASARVIREKLTPRHKPRQLQQSDSLLKPDLLRPTEPSSRLRFSARGADGQGTRQGSLRLARLDLRQNPCLSAQTSSLENEGIQSKPKTKPKSPDRGASLARAALPQHRTATGPAAGELNCSFQPTNNTHPTCQNPSVTPKRDFDFPITSGICEIADA